MGRLQLSWLVITGLVLIALGAIGLAFPIFTTSQSKDVANIGDLKIQTTQSMSYTIPPIASAGAVAVGLVLLGVGIVRRRV